MKIRAQRAGHRSIHLHATPPSTHACGSEWRGREEGLEQPSATFARPGGRAELVAVAGAHLSSSTAMLTTGSPSCAAARAMSQQHPSTARSSMPAISKVVMAVRTAAPDDLSPLGIKCCGRRVAWKDNESDRSSSQNVILCPT